MQYSDNVVNKLKTPCYIINAEKFELNVAYIRSQFSKFMCGGLPIMGYSVKTNHNVELMKIAKKIGMYAEVVSDDEYQHSVNCGFPGNRIIFNGPQKSPQKLIEALQSGAVVNLDNNGEIDVIERNRYSLNLEKVCLGLRVNFNLEAQCPNETTAGDSVSRFGFCVENGDFNRAVKRLQNLGIPVKGLHMHYSTKTRSLDVFEKLSSCAKKLIEQYNLIDTLEYIDIGGGFFMGEQYIMEGKPPMEEYARTICTCLKETIDMQKVAVILEPGASVIASAIQYLTMVINTRDIQNVRVVTVDGSLLHINPFMTKRTPQKTLYCFSGKEKIHPRQVICGCTCMENDRFFELVDDVALCNGDGILFGCAGAYTMGFNNAFINSPPYIYLLDENGTKCVREKNSATMGLV